MVLGEAAVLRDVKTPVSPTIILGMSPRNWDFGAGSVLEQGYG